jgi:hypothetical protein
MTTNAEEAPFISAMEREPEAPKSGWHDATITIDHIGRKLFTADGMAWELLKKLRAMFAQAERGPEDYANPPAIAISGGGNYRPKSDWARRRNSIIDGLLIAGIIALVSTSVFLLKTTVRLDTQYTERGQLYDERFKSIREDNVRQDGQLGRHDERLNRLEQQRRDAQRNSDDQ